MNKTITDILESTLSLEYLTIADAIAEIDEQIELNTSSWEEEKPRPVFTKRQITGLQARRRILVREMTDVTNKINGEKFEAAKIDLPEAILAKEEPEEPSTSENTLIMRGCTLLKSEQEVSNYIFSEALVTETYLVNDFNIQGGKRKPTKDSYIEVTIKYRPEEYR